MQKVELSSIALLVAVVLTGCNSQPTPAFASSANESSYAERYPETLLALRTEYANDETRAGEIFSGFSSYPGALSAPNGEQVLNVVDRADAAGKNGAYAQEMDEHEHVARFFSEEKESLNQRVGGAAQHAAKQKECTVDVASPAIGALDRGVDKALQERLRDHNEAQRYIEDHEDALGKPNLEKLQKQADDIALASFLVHVRVKQIKVELARLVDESSGVKKTLERSRAEADAVSADASASRSAKTTAAARARATKSASARIDSEVDQAKRALSDMNARSDKLEKDYGASFDALEKALKALPKK